MYIPTPYDFERHFENWVRNDYQKEDRPLKFKWIYVLNRSDPPEKWKCEKREEILRDRIEEFQIYSAHDLYRCYFEYKRFDDYDTFKKKFADMMLKNFLHRETAKANEWKEFLKKYNIREDQIVNKEWIKNYTPEQGAKAFDAPANWENREE